MPDPQPVISLAGLTLPSALPGRDLPRLAQFRTEDPALRARYDDRVLFYSAARVVDRGVLRLYGPRALNLAPLLRQAVYTADGQPLGAPRLRRFKRYVIAEFPLMAPAAQVTMSVAGEALTMPIVEQDLTGFAGLNTLYTMSQNNDPDWIADWLRYYHRQHGADAVLIADNASTAYDPAWLVERLSALPFLKRVQAISVPFKYGPSSAICRRASGTRYLQSGIANFSKDALLAGARAVLSCDIDEMVVSRAGRSVFDTCVSSRLGFVTVPGYWRFTKPTGARPLHRDHVWIDPDRAKPCPTKYAINPRGPVGRWSWMTHSLESLPRGWFSGAPDLWFAHCYDITNRWKEGREESTDRDHWQRDEALAQVWDR